MSTTLLSPSALLSASKGTSIVRRAGRAAEVVDFEEGVVAFFVDAAALLGVPKSVAAIYGICFASAEPVGFADIELRLHLSTGSISQGLKVLREVGALKPVGAEQDRRETLVPDLELRKLVEHWLAERLQRQLASGQERLQALGGAVPGVHTPSAKVLCDRLKLLQAWHTKASSVLPVVRAILKPG